jgi:hypothetical protein
MHLHRRNSVGSHFRFRQSADASSTRFSDRRVDAVTWSGHEPFSITRREICLVVETAGKRNLTNIDPSTKMSRSVDQQAMRLLQSHLHQFAVKRRLAVRTCRVMPPIAAPFATSTTVSGFIAASANFSAIFFEL